MSIRIGTGVETRRQVVIRSDSPAVARYSLQQAITPCRAEWIVKRHWWVVDPTSKVPCVIFLHSLSGDVPQASDDDMVINLMKRILFPWADIVLLDKVYLVKYNTKGWQVPYGRLS